MTKRTLNWANGRKYGVKAYNQAPKSAQQTMDRLVGKGKKSGWIKRNGDMIYVVLMQCVSGWQVAPWVATKRICLGGVVTCAD